MNQSFNESELSEYPEDGAMFTTNGHKNQYMMSPSIRIDSRILPQMNNSFPTESFDSEDDCLSAVLHMKTIEMLALIKGTSPQEAYLMENAYEIDRDEDGSIENEQFYYVDYSVVNDDADQLSRIDWETGPAEEDIIFDIEL